MLRFLFRVLAACVVLATGCSVPEAPSAALPKPPPPSPAPDPAHFAPATVGEFQKAASRFKSVIGVPRLETTPERLQRSLTTTMTRTSAALDALASCAHER